MNEALHVAELAARGSIVLPPSEQPEPLTDGDDGLHLEGVACVNGSTDLARIGNSPLCPVLVSV